MEPPACFSSPSKVRATPDTQVPAGWKRRAALPVPGRFSWSNSASGKDRSREAPRWRDGDSRPGGPLRPCLAASRRARGCGRRHPPIFGGTMRDGWQRHGARQRPTTLPGARQADGGAKKSCPGSGRKFPTRTMGCALERMQPACNFPAASRPVHRAAGQVATPMASFRCGGGSEIQPAAVRGPLPNAFSAIRRMNATT